jgi:hypothetical protein
MRNARCIRGRSEICHWVVHIVNPLPWWRSKKGFFAARDDPDTGFLRPFRDFATTCHTQTTGWRYHLPRSDVIETIAAVKDSTGGTKEDCQLDDQSKRIHTVIHM